MFAMLTQHVTKVAMASLTLWNAKMLCLLLKIERASVEHVTTDLLSPNIYD